MKRPNVRRSRELRRVATEAERRLWSKLRAGLLGARFVRQHPVGPYIADFTCRSLRLVIEVDGGQHGGIADERRDLVLREHGYEILRFWNSEVLGNLDGVVSVIERTLQRLRRDDSGK